MNHVTVGTKKIPAIAVPKIPNHRREKRFHTVAIMEAELFQCLALVEKVDQIVD